MNRPAPASALLAIAASLSTPAAPVEHPAGPHTVQHLPFVVVDGLALHDGDMVLGTAEELASARASKRESPRSGRRDVALPHWEFSLWPDGVVPYVVDEEFGPEALANIRSAIEEWNTRTVISLVPRTSRADFVRFTASHSGTADLAHQGGEQRIWLEPDEGCGVSAIIHEIGHAVGLLHEHQRDDRHDWFTIRPDMNFGPDSQWHVSDARAYGPYDYRSTMHYRIAAIESIPPGIPSTN